MTTNKLLFSLIFSILAALPSSHAAPNYIESYGRIPLAFTANDGRTAPEVAFTTNGAGCGMFFTSSGTTYVLDGGSSDAAAKPGVHGESDGRESFALVCRFLGANRSPEITGEDRLPWNSNYFIGGDPAKWRTDVPNYGNIRLHDLYNGVDLVYYGNRSRLKYDFIIYPGEDPSTIRLQYDFGDAGGTLALNADGDLVVSTPAGDLVERAPYAYQMIDGGEIEVEAHYRIIDADAGEYGFIIGGYDPAHELVIDPELVYSTYLGSDRTEDSFIDMAVDPEGYVYIFGEPGYEEFPVTPGAYDTEYNKLFITKMNQDGSGLVYSTFFGRSENRSIEGDGIQVDSSGNVYITGGSGTEGFPVTPGAFDTDAKGGDVDAYITKINSTGDELIYSTFIGGHGADRASDIAIDVDGNACITGYAVSSDFPVTLNAYDITFDDNRETFVTKLNHEGTGLIFSTFMGGQSDSFALTIDDSGNIYVTGNTGDTYEPTPGAYDESYNGGYGDVFVSKLSADGGELMYATFLGGSGDKNYEGGSDIVADSFGNAYIVGRTASEDFPTTPGSFDQSYNGGNYDAFITKLNADGSDLVFSTFLGSDGAEYGRSVSLDHEGNIYITGNSSQIEFPITSSIYQGRAFISILDAHGSNLKYSTMFGGLAGGGSSPRSIQVDADGNMYIGGETVSWEFPVTENAYDDSLYYYYSNEGFGYGVRDLFISKLSSIYSTGVETSSGTLPTPHLALMNYPNPFNASTTISYTLTEASHVRILIYNVSGQMIAELVNSYIMAGTHNIVWNASDIASGIYIVRIMANGHASQCKMILMK